MSKQNFLELLREALSTASVAGIDSMIDYYSEMIDDRVEDGMSEEEAVASMESIDSIVEASRFDKPMPVLMKEKVNKSKEKAAKSGHKGLWVALAIIGFPIWLPLLIVLFTVILVIYICFWVIIVSFIAVWISLLICAGALLLLPFFSFAGAVTASMPGILLCIGGSLLLAGLFILLRKPILALCKAAIDLFKKFILAIKKSFFS